MPIYERPTKSLMADWAKEHLSAGQIFKKSAVERWFAERYPKIKRNTVNMHVEGMSVNNRNRKHHSNVKPGSGHKERNALLIQNGDDGLVFWRIHAATLSEACFEVVWGKRIPVEPQLGGHALLAARLESGLPTVNESASYP